MSNLEILPLSFGANNLKFGKQEIIITKGEFRSETAWGGDGYSVLIKDDKGWQFVRLQKKLGNNVMIWSIPHTYEDSIKAVYFMKPKSDVNNQEISDLHLLIAQRKYKESPEKPAPTEFSLFMLSAKNDEFEIRYFVEEATANSHRLYCNADSAIRNELNVVLASDNLKDDCTAGTH